MTQIFKNMRVVVVHHHDPYHPTPSPHIGKVGTVTRVVDGAWGERCSIRVDGTNEEIRMGTHEVRPHEGGYQESNLIHLFAQ